MIIKIRTAMCEFFIGNFIDFVNKIYYTYINYGRK